MKLMVAKRHSEEDSQFDYTEVRMTFQGYRGTPGTKQNVNILCMEPRCIIVLVIQ